MTFTLARPGLYGDYLGKPVRAFMAGLMLLTGLILLAACANLGSLFAARAADRSREVALRLALGATRVRILRGLFTEAILISLAGGWQGSWAALPCCERLLPGGLFRVGLSISPSIRMSTCMWRPCCWQLSADCSLELCLCGRCCRLIRTA